MPSTVVKNKTDGYHIGSGPTEKIGLFGATPVVQPSGAAQAAVAGTAGAAVATTAPTNTSPYGFSQQQATDLVARVNQLLVDNAALIAECNALRAALVSLGVIKGAA